MHACNWCTSLANARSNKQIAVALLVSCQLRLWLRFCWLGCDILDWIASTGLNCGLDLSGIQVRQCVGAHWTNAISPWRSPHFDMGHSTLNSIFPANSPPIVRSSSPFLRSKIRTCKHSERLLFLIRSCYKIGKLEYLDSVRATLYHLLDTQ